MLSFAEQRRLLELERQAERKEVEDVIAQESAADCVARGISILPLCIREAGTGLFGASTLTLVHHKDRPLPAHRLGSGDEVRLRRLKQTPAPARDEEGTTIVSAPIDLTGVVTRVEDESLVVNVSGEESLDLLQNQEELMRVFAPPLRLDLLASEATHRKRMQALRVAEEYEIGGAATPVREIILGLAAPDPRPTFDPQPLVQYNPGLNEVQMDAVRLALSSNRITLIHGPPGTGKTTTIIELILHARAQGQKLLVCAPSNVAVDNMLERLARVPEHRDAGSSANDGAPMGAPPPPKPQLVRIGHPARLSESALRHSLEAKVQEADESRLVDDIKKELSLGSRHLSRTSRKQQEKRRELGRELRSLRKELRVRQRKVVQNVIEEAGVVLCTCTGASSSVLRDFDEFDLVIIDEAAQALEADCWTAILKGKKLVLAGDHKQLPPTLRVEGNGKKKGSPGLGYTLFERLIDQHGDIISRMLTVQYRMNSTICRWASEAMYEGRLVAADGVGDRIVEDLVPPTAQLLRDGGQNETSNAQASSNDATVEDHDDLTNAVMLFLDTAGCEFEEQIVGEGSHRNEQEGCAAIQHVIALLNRGLTTDQICMITPYNGQVEFLREERSRRGTAVVGLEKVDIRTVDGFQGGEREAVVLSLVRSNPTRTVGFLADNRRLNVAITRAKRHVCVVGDSETISSDAFLKSIFEYIEENGEVQSALVYAEQDLVEEDVSKFQSNHVDNGEVGMLLVSEALSTLRLDESSVMPQPEASTDGQLEVAKGAHDETLDPVPVEGLQYLQETRSPPSPPSANELQESLGRIENDTIEVAAVERRLEHEDEATKQGSPTVTISVKYNGESRDVTIAEQLSVMDLLRECVELFDVEASTARLVCKGRIHKWAKDDDHSGSKAVNLLESGMSDGGIARLLGQPAQKKGRERSAVGREKGQSSTPQLRSVRDVPEVDAFEKKYKRQLQDLKDARGQFRVRHVLKLPASLKAKERARIHEWATELGLAHCSKGSGPARYVQVRRLGNGEENPPEGELDLAGQTVDGDDDAETYSEGRDGGLLGLSATLNDDTGEDSEEHADASSFPREESEPKTASPQPSSNSLLGDLHRERAERRARQRSAERSGDAADGDDIAFLDRTITENKSNQPAYARYITKDGVLTSGQGRRVSERDRVRKMNLERSIAKKIGQSQAKRLSTSAAAAKDKKEQEAADARLLGRKPKKKKGSKRR